MENKKELKFFLNDEENSASTEAEDKKAHKSSHTHSHHSHHGHHSHHRHSSKKRSQQENKNQKENFKNFIKRNKKYLIYLGITLLLILSLVIFGVYLDSIMSYSDGSEDEDSNDITEQTYSDLKISVPFFEDEVVIVGPAVVELMNADSSVEVKNIYNKYKSASDRLDVGLPVKLKYNIDKISVGYNVKSTEFLVSETSDFKSPLVFKTEGSKNYVDVYHLKTGTQYYYKIILTFNNGNVSSVSGSFKTATGPRVLTLDGVYNLRDIGGYTTSDGKAIKQGILYRGCEIDGSIEEHYKISSDGLNTMLSNFGIKTDMDLRASTDNKYGTDALGSGVKHIYYSAPMYSNIFNDDINREKIRAIFADLADANNYPVYLHCTYGTDRTGTVVYLLEGLLGVDEETLLKDYKLSGLHHGAVSIEAMNEFVNNVKQLPGETIEEKIEGYLLSIGVTVDEIANIRAIFLNN
jgi:protein-tyrosine phosphatase